MINYSEKICEACLPDADKASDPMVQNFLEENASWDLIKDNDIQKLSKVFTFANFIEAQNFTNMVANMAEKEGHHPDIWFGWGYAKIKIFTHAIKGLAESDFILAAKIDKIN